MEQTIVELKHLSKIYQQGDLELKAVNDVSLIIRKGDFAALCGPSGSGKTSILNLIGGLDKYHRSVPEANADIFPPETVPRYVDRIRVELGLW